MAEERFKNPEVCTRCGGACCKQTPGCNLPSDFGATHDEIAHNLTAALQSGKWAVDWWEGYLDDERIEDPYFIRPATKNAGSIYDPSWGGECVLLTPAGCSLSYDKRPAGCRLLEPRDSDCLVHGAGKREAAKAWLPYYALIKEIADRIQASKERRVLAMKPITLPTTTAQRANLVAAGWELWLEWTAEECEGTDYQPSERWEYEWITITITADGCELRDGSCDHPEIPLAKVLEFAAILGLLAPPKGMVLISVEDAKECEAALKFTEDDTQKLASLWQNRWSAERVAEAKAYIDKLAEARDRLRKSLNPETQEPPTPKE